MALPQALLGGGWAETTARRALPVLVWCAENGKKITYGQLDVELQRRGWADHKMAIAYRFVCRDIGDALLELEAEMGGKIPPVNALVVNADTGIAGDGCDYYLSSYLARRPRGTLSAAQRKAMSEQTMEAVWRYQKWPDVLVRFGLRPLRGGVPSLRSNIAPRKPTKGGWSNEPETQEHRALKLWVAENPHILDGTGSIREVHTEWLFASADRADVLVVGEGASIAAEVKAAASNNADLERGIYQCVKYRALLRAELQAEGRVPNGSAVLVIERELPARLVALAELFDVPWVVVPGRG